LLLDSHVIYIFYTSTWNTVTFTCACAITNRQKLKIKIHDVRDDDMIVYRASAWSQLHDNGISHIIVHNEIVLIVKSTWVRV
jgi:hypothetical protein